MGFGAGWLLVRGSGMLIDPYFVIYCAVLAAAAIAIPVRKLVPDHTGSLLSVLMFARAKDDVWSEFPTRLAGEAVIAASVFILLTVFETSRSDLFWTGIVVLTGILLALLILAHNAPALSDLASLSAAALIAIVAGGTGLWNMQAIAALEPETDMPLMASTLVAFGLVLSIVAAWRSLRGGAAKLFIAAVPRSSPLQWP